MMNCVSQKPPINYKFLHKSPGKRQACSDCSWKYLSQKNFHNQPHKNVGKIVTFKEGILCMCLCIYIYVLALDVPLIVTVRPDCIWLQQVPSATWTNCVTFTNHNEEAPLMLSSLLMWTCDRVVDPRFGEVLGWKDRNLDENWCPADDPGSWEISKLVISWGCNFK